MPPISPFGWMTILIAAVESPAFSSTCRTAGLVSAFQTRLIAASRSGQYARALGGQRSTAAGGAGLGVLLGMGRAGATSLGTVISWSRFCNDATWGARVAFATVGGVGAVFDGAGGDGGAGFGCGTGACST